jgi:hypothetical protein
LFKLDSFDNAPGFDVEAWNDSHGEHVRQETKNSAALNPAFSLLRTIPPPHFLPRTCSDTEP